MLLEHIGETKASAEVEGTVAELIQTGKIRSLKAGEHRCSELGQMVADRLRERARATR
jgi:isocitrate/isopropylmalate dehydrogenase